MYPVWKGNPRSRLKVGRPFTAFPGETPSAFSPQQTPSQAGAQELPPSALAPPPAGTLHGRQTFTTGGPLATESGQNKGVLFPGPVQAPTAGAPLARSAPRMPPVSRPILTKSCRSCG